MGGIQDKVYAWDVGGMSNNSVIRSLHSATAWEELQALLIENSREFRKPEYHYFIRQLRIHLLEVLDDRSVVGVDLINMDIPKRESDVKKEEDSNPRQQSVTKRPRGRPRKDATAFQYSTQNSSMNADSRIT